MQIVRLPRNFVELLRQADSFLMDAQVKAFFFKNGSAMSVVVNEKMLHFHRIISGSELPSPQL